MLRPKPDTPAPGQESVWDYPRPPRIERVDVSIAYPMLSLGYVVSAFGAWMFLGEAVSPQRLVAIGVIVVGVVLLART